MVFVVLVFLESQQFIFGVCYCANANNTKRRVIQRTIINVKQITPIMFGCVVVNIKGFGGVD